MTAREEILIRELQDRILSGSNDSNEIESHRNNLLEFAREEVERHPFFCNWGKGVGATYSEVLKLFIFEQSLDISKIIPHIRNMSPREVRVCIENMEELGILKKINEFSYRMAECISSKLDNLSRNAGICEIVLIEYHKKYEQMKDKYLLDNADSIIKATEPVT